MEDTINSPNSMGDRELQATASTSHAVSLRAYHSILIRPHCCFSFVSFGESQVTGCLLYMDQGGIANFF
jgi:hypothetical protein